MLGPSQNLNMGNLSTYPPVVKIELAVCGKRTSNGLTKL